MATWWITPAIIGGVMLYAKHKAAAAYRWYDGTEESAKDLPVALLMAKISTGDVLPAAPQGFVWKPIEINFASSPFQTPQSLLVNVLSAVTKGTAGPVAGFLTAQALMGTGMGGFLTSQEVAASAMDGFLDKEAMASAAHMGEVLRREDYLYAPQTAPDFGGMGCRSWGRMSGLGEAVGTAVARLREDLRARGLSIVPIGAAAAGPGDFVVTADDCALHVVEPGGVLREIHPRKGQRSHGHGRGIACAFGLRRA